MHLEPASSYIMTERTSRLILTEPPPFEASLLLVDDSGVADLEGKGESYPEPASLDSMII